MAVSAPPPESASDRLPLPLRPAAEAGGWSAGRFLLLLSLVLVAAFPAVWGGVSFVYRDFGAFTFPVAFHARESLWRGELPLWNPLSDCGVPFLAQWNSLVLYPGSLIYLLLPLPWSLNLFQVVHLALGALGMHQLARRYTGCPLGAAVAGFAWAFNGVSLSSLMWTSTTASLAWMPWVILTLERAWREGGRALVLAALVGACQMLSGTPEVILLTWLLGAGLCAGDQVSRMCSLRTAVRIAGRCGGRHFAVLASLGRPASASSPTEAQAEPEGASGPEPRAQRPDWRPWGRLVAVALCVTGLAAAQLLPFLELTALSQRDAEFARQQDAAAAWWTLPANGWANLVVPAFRCQRTPWDTWVHATESWVPSFYPGAGVLCLAASGLLSARRRRAWFLAGVALLAWWMALGGKAGLYDWAGAVFPPLRLMRYPVKCLVVSLFVLPLLAAWGVGCLLQPGAAGRQTWRRALAAAGILGMIGAAVVGYAWRHPIPGESLPTMLRQGALGGLAAGAALGLRWTMMADLRPLLRRLAGAGLLVLLALDLLFLLPRLAPVVPAGAFEPGAVALAPRPQPGQHRAMATAEAVRTAETHPQPTLFRQFALQRLGLMYNANLLEGIPTVGGFFPLYLRDTDRVEAWARERLPPGLLDFLGVVQVTAPGQLTAWNPRPTALPLATAGQTVVCADPPATLRGMIAPEFDPRQVVYLPAQAQPESASVRSGAARILGQEFRAHRVQLDLEAAAPSVAVIAQSFHPAWRAELDGQPVRLWRANYAFQAVLTPPGRHRVTLRYVDRAFLAGLGLGLLALGVLAALWRRASSG